MPVTEAQVQALIITKVGDLDPVSLDPVPTQSPPTAGTGLLATNLATVWAYYADKAGIGPRLQALYVERDLLVMKLDALGMLMDMTPVAGLAFHESQKAAVYLKRYDQLVADIARTEAGALAAGRIGGAIGPLAQQAPAQPPTPAPATPYAPPSPYMDPNDPRFSGSPYWPGPLRRSLS